MSSSPQTDVRRKLLFIRSPQHSLVVVEKYLTKRGYEVFIEDKLLSASQLIQKENPDYIFMALDHVDKNIDLLFNQLISSSKSVVIPYIVSVYNKDVLKLMQAQSSSAIKINPPLTGPSIQRAIVTYEKENAQEPIEDSVLVKGPRFNLNSENESSSRVQFSTNKTRDSLIINQAETTPAPLKQRSFSEEQKNKINTFFEDYVKADLEKDLIRIMSEREAESAATADQPNAGYTLLIECQGFSGAFLFTSKFKFKLSDIEEHLNKFASGVAELATEKTEGSQPPATQSKLFEIKLSEVSDLDQLHLTSNYNAVVCEDSLKSSINFYNLENNPFSNIKKSNDNSYLKLDPSLIKVNSVITFDIFFEFKQNKKFLRYLKDGTKINSEILNKLNVGPDLYTDSSSENSWYEYAMSSFIQNKTAKKADSK